MGILPVQGEKLESSITTGVLALWPARPRVAALAMQPLKGVTSAISFSFASLTDQSSFHLLSQQSIFVV